MEIPCSGDLQPLLAEFTRFLQQRAVADTAVRELLSPYSRASDSAHADTNLASWTLPNERGGLPPGQVCNLRATDFPPPAYRTRDDFVPAAVHMLAAHRLYPYLLSPEGLHTTPMAFLLRMRLLDSLRFLDVPPILGASYSARFGRYGVTIMHLLRANLAAQLVAGLTDANFSLDFGANVAPPACASYHDLLGAILGFTTFANAEWYEPMTHPLYRLREFVTANMDADPGNSPQRVKRTLHEVNQFLGATFVHLSSDSPAWWWDFCAASHRITFSSASWAIALCANITPPDPPPLPTTPRRLAPTPSAGSPASTEHGLHKRIRAAFQHRCGR